MHSLYPSDKQESSPDIVSLAKSIMTKFGYTRPEGTINPFLVDVSFMPYRMSTFDRERFEKRNDRDIKYYIRSTKLETDKVLLVVIPITMKNMFFSVSIFIKRIVLDYFN